MLRSSHLPEMVFQVSFGLFCFVVYLFIYFICVCFVLFYLLLLINLYEVNSCEIIQQKIDTIQVFHHLASLFCNIPEGTGMVFESQICLSPVLIIQINPQLTFFPPHAFTNHVAHVQISNRILPIPLLANHTSKCSTLLHNG